MSIRTLLHIVLVIALAVAALLLIRLHSAAAQSVDPHKLYEETCARCHQPHAVTLVREHLKLEGGKVLTKEDGREVARLLANHARLKLAAAEINALVGQFDAMLKTGWLFQDRCYNCHGPASVFARTSLKLDGAKVVSKASGRDLAEFLRGHGHIYGDEQRATILDMLRRQLQTQ